MLTEVNELRVSFSLSGPPAFLFSPVFPALFVLSIFFCPPSPLQSCEPEPKSRQLVFGRCCTRSCGSTLAALADNGSHFPPDGGRSSGLRCIYTPAPSGASIHQQPSDLYGWNTRDPTATINGESRPPDSNTGGNTKNTNLEKQATTLDERKATLACLVCRFEPRHTYSSRCSSHCRPQTRGGARQRACSTWRQGPSASVSTWP